MAKTAKITVSLSTNPATAHIGPFFADLRDTTNGRNHQMTTRIGTAAMLAEFISNVHKACHEHSVELSFQDDTLKNDFTARGGLIGTPFSD